MNWAPKAVTVGRRSSPASKQPPGQVGPFDLLPFKTGRMLIVRVASHEAPDRLRCSSVPSTRRALKAVSDALLEAFGAIDGAEVRRRVEVSHKQSVL
jgi:hypothetical protein